MVEKFVIILVLIMVSILAFLFFMFIKCCLYDGCRLDKYNYLKTNEDVIKLSLKQFKEFFLLKPNAYITLEKNSYHNGYGILYEVSYREHITICGKTFIEHLKMRMLISSYKKNQSKYKAQKAETALMNKYLDNIKKDIEKMNAQSARELSEASDILKKVKG